MRGLRAGVDDDVVELEAADDERVAEVVDVDLAGLRPRRPDHTIGRMEHRLPERDRPWMMRTYSGHSTAKKSNELYRANLGKGQTGLSIAFDLPTQTGYDPDHELARGEVGKVGVPVAHKGDMHALLDGIPLDDDEHVDDDQRDRGLAAGALHRRRRGERARPRGAPGHDPERHHQGVPGPRDLRLPARPVDAADRRHGGLHRRARPALEPDQHLLLPPAGGGGHAGAGDRLRDGQRHRGARRRARARRRGAHGQGLRAHLVLRQRRRALRRGARQAARDGRAVGGARPRALRRAATPSTCASATACRSTRSASPSPSPRTTSSASCSRRWRSRSGATRGRARSSCRPGTRRSGCRARGTSSGRCASSRCWPTRPTCSSTPTSSRARRSWTGSWPSCWRARAPRWRSSTSTAARSTPWTT